LHEVPPHAIESERIIVAAACWENENLESATSQLSRGDFYDPTCGALWAAVSALAAEGGVVDAASINTYLRDRSTERWPDKRKPVTVIAEVVDCTPAAGKLQGHIDAVLNASQQRKVIALGHKVASEGYHGSSRPPHLKWLESVTRRFEEVCLPRQDAALIPVSRACQLAKEQDIADNSIVAPTGIRDLDTVLGGGMRPGELITVAARPGMGKTALGTLMALSGSLQVGPTLLFSLEQTAEELTQRIVTSLAHLDLRKVRARDLTDEQWSLKDRAYGGLARLPLHIDDGTDRSAAQISAIIRQFATRNGSPPALVVIDYLQLLRAPRGCQNREGEVSNMTRTLKNAAKEHGCPIVILCQLNRRVEERSKKIPQLSDLRESGAIEQDSNTVIFIWRADYYELSDDESGIARLNVAKQRNGPSQTFVRCRWHGPSVTFSNL
jgi:replicative DNA helicase